MEFLVQIVLLIALVVMARLAWQYHGRVRAAECSRVLQRATLAMCAQLMADDTNSKAVRRFAGTLSLFAMSEKALWSFANNKHLLKLLAKAKDRDDADGVQASELTEADRKKLQPAVELFAMASLLNDPEQRETILAVWEQFVSQTLAEANAGKIRPLEGNRPVAPESVASRIEKVEQDVAQRVEEFCHAC